MYVYASLMKGYTRNRDLKRAIKLYEKVKESEEVKINIFFYNSFLGYFISYKKFYL
jgi:pentatricopeptide repeat protein